MKRPRPAADAHVLSARRAALRVLLAANGELRFDVAFERELSRRPLDPKDRALARTLAVGTLKLRRRLDFILEQFVEKKHRPLPLPIQQVLRLGAYQLLELSRVPRFAAVSTSVELAKQWGHTGTSRLVNAVLRRLAEHPGDWPWPKFDDDPVGHLGTRYSYPNWLVRMWLHEYGEAEAIRRCKSGNRSAGVNVRLVRLSRWEKTQIEWLTRLHISSRQARWFPEYRFLPDPPDLSELTAKHGHDLLVQNEAAAAAVYLLDLQSGESAVEVGSAPGGKITHAAGRSGPAGRLLAMDVNRRRLRRLTENLRRTELDGILPVKGDGRHLPVRNLRKILVDAPCSGLGLLHRHPDLRWQKRPEDISRLAEVQRDLMEAAWDALPPGGRLVYSTCTTSREENDGLIAEMLKAHDDATVIDPRSLMPTGVPANAHWVRIDPDPPRLDGAFACALQKTLPA